MRFALVNNKRVEADPGLKRGSCPGCSQAVIAKCGIKRSPHWAHLSKKTCASWWEPETEWHRSWKNNFPFEWQEFYLPDEQTGEKHMADVRTSGGLVIEFQHSHIDPKERIARESFYQNMVWIVDGTRLKGDYQRFLKGKSYSRSIGKKFFGVDHRVPCFPSGWVGSSVPVIFDFRGSETIDPMDLRNDLYCLFPNRLGLDSIFVVISRGIFIDIANDDKWSQWARNRIEDISLGRLESKIQGARQPKTKNIIRREPTHYLERGVWKRRRPL